MKLLSLLRVCNFPLYFHHFDRYYYYCPFLCNPKSWNIFVSSYKKFQSISIPFLGPDGMRVVSTVDSILNGYSVRFTPRMVGSHQVQVQMPIQERAPAEVNFNMIAYDYEAIAISRKLPSGQLFLLDHLTPSEVEGNLFPRKQMHRMCIDNTATFVGMQSTRLLNVSQHWIFKLFWKF